MLGAMGRRRDALLELRAVLLELLGVLGRPAKVAELVRMLAVHGLRPPGRASQTVSNALRIEVGWGTVVRIERGVYALATDSMRWMARGREPGDPAERHRGAMPISGPTVTVPPGVPASADASQ